MASTDFDKQLQQANILLKLTKLREQDQLCDLTIKCGETEINVHRTVVAAHSDWFLKACAGGFKESGASTIELPDDDLDEVEAMLNFCYTLEYPAPRESPLTFDARMFAIGEKYLMEALQSYAADQFRKHLKNGDSHNDFKTAVNLVYSGMSDANNTIREIILQDTLARSIRSFPLERSKDEWMLDVPAFMLDILRVVRCIPPPNSEHTIFKCPTDGCDQHFSISTLRTARSAVVQCMRCEQRHDLSAGEWYKHRMTIRDVLDREGPRM